MNIQIYIVRQEWHWIKIFLEDGSWLKPPPSYPPIAGPGSQSSHNLEDFTRMEEDNSEYGPVLSLTEFVRKFHLNNWDTSIPLIIVTIFNENTILKWYFISPRRDLRYIFQAVETWRVLTSYNHFFLRLPDPDLNNIFTWDDNWSNSGEKYIDTTLHR